MRDIELLQTIARLTAEGLGLEGVKRVIELQNQVLALQEKVAELQQQLAAADQVQNLPVPFASQHVTVWRRTPR